MSNTAMLLQRGELMKFILHCSFRDCVLHFGLLPKYMKEKVFEKINKKISLNIIITVTELQV